MMFLSRWSRNQLEASLAKVVREQLRMHRPLIRCQFITSRYLLIGERDTAYVGVLHESGQAGLCHGHRPSSI